MTRSYAMPMESQGRGPMRGLSMRCAPLALCYVVFPASVQWCLLIGAEVYRNWIDIAWVGLTVTAVMLHPLPARRSIAGAFRVIVTVLIALVIGLATLSVLSGASPAVTTAMELKPVAYGLVVLLLVGRLATPRARDFARYGAGLSCLLITEALLRSLLSGFVVRPVGSGEVNYDGALLCVSLVFATADRGLSRRYTLIILAGIVARFSRTSLLAACLVLLLSPVISLRLRLLTCSVAIGAVLASFVIRDLEVGNLESLDRYWMWLTGLEYFSSHLANTAFSLTPGRQIDVEVPIFVAELWSDQQENLDLDGVYPFHFHAMWLRLAVSWGWLPIVFVMVTLFRRYVVDRRRALQSRPFFIVIAVLGLTMGLIYLGNVAVVVLLAAYRIHLLRRPRLRQTTSASQKSRVSSAAISSGAAGGRPTGEAFI